MATQHNDPVVQEYIAHPSFRPVATFFLGLVFLSCIQFSISVPLAFLHRRLFHRPHSRSLIGGRGLEANRSEEKVNAWLNTNARSITPLSSGSHRLSTTTDPFSLALNIAFAMATVAQMGSLLLFSKSQLGGCAFLVAWSGMAAQCVRILGLMKLSLDMRKLGLNRWELYAFWLVLFASAVVMFVNNSLSVGILELVRPDSKAMLCFRDRMIGLAVAQSCLNIVLEIYTLARLISLIAPWFLSSQHQFDAVMDIRVGRALSLLVLDVATAVPAAKFFSVLADSIPESLTALLVLAAFNHRSPNISTAPTASIPPTHYPQSLQSEPIVKTPSMISSPVAVRPNRYSHPDHSLSHPFAARSLGNPAPETEDWPTSAIASKLSIPEPAVVLHHRHHHPRGVRSSPSKSRRHTWRTSKRVSNVSTISQSDSELARSVKGAVVGFAFKDTVGGSGEKGMREREADSSFVPVMTKPVIRVTKKAAQEGRPRGARPMPSEGGVATAAVRPSSSHIPHIAVTSQASFPGPVDSPQRERGSSNASSSSVQSGTTSTTGVNSLKGTPGSDLSVGSFHLTPSTPVQRSRHESAVTVGTTNTNTNTELERRESWPYDDGGYSSRRHSQDTMRSNKSEISLPPANDDLSIVYEASHEESDTPPSRRGPRRTTFGEQTFSNAGVMLRARDGEGYPFVEGRDVAVPEGVPEDVAQESNGSSRSRREGVITK